MPEDGDLFAQSPKTINATFMHRDLTGSLSFILHCIMHWLMIKTGAEKAQSPFGRTLHFVQPQVTQFSTTKFLMHPHESPSVLWTKELRAALFCFLHKHWTEPRGCTIVVSVRWGNRALKSDKTSRVISDLYVRNANTQRRGLPKNLQDETLSACQLPYSAYDLENNLHTSQSDYF